MHTLSISYRPDNYPDWIPWKTFSGIFDIIGKASALGTGGVPSAKPGFKPRLSFGKPPDACDDLSTSRRLRRGFNFQVKLNGSGHVVIERFRLHAQRLTENSRATKL